ncbi:hypothetical protein SLEP1_g48576 [Rubroshorea leprosula]|uniref:Integrase catalytic domain-containing protein n=1 Tax=Rubroshorea leprosula TaxID=152421 RepID=A0AAV5LUY0_9ROSI|nr:hypothetical protein SLEP1_g48576 [Rubroshorea leprosula]
MSSSSGQHGGSLSNLPLFTRKNYDVWAIQMKAFLKGNYGWDSMEKGFNPPRLPQNPLVAQIKQYVQYVASSYKALLLIHSVVADEIFPRIMRAETTQVAWEILQKEFEGDERIKGQKIVNIKKEFVMMRMKETNTIHKHSNKLMDVVNQIRLPVDKCSWFVDSDCTYHMANNEAIFSELDKSMRIKVKLGNGSIVQLEGKGIVAVQTKKARHKFIFMFKKFKVLAENQSGCKNKALRSDNGKESTLKEFDNFCEDVEIAHQLTVPYIPQQNGVSERKNRTIMEMARCILHEKKLLKNFLAKAVYTAVYLLNGLPTKAMQGKTPIEACYGVKPSAHHLKILALFAILMYLVQREPSLMLKLKLVFWHLDAGTAGLIHFSFSKVFKGVRMSQPWEMSYFLGMEIHQCESGIFVSQHKYALDVLKKFSMDQCKSAPTPLIQNSKLIAEDGYEKTDASIYRSLVGSLLYLTTTRLDLMYAASLLFRFMHSPSQAHFGVAKRVLRYLKGTSNYGLWFEKHKHGILHCFSNSDCARSHEDAKSTTGFVFFFGSIVFSWMSRKQEVVAQSTTEAKCIVVAKAINHVAWINKMLTNMGCYQLKPCVIHCDNNSTIAIAHNPVQYGHTKHINVKFQVLRNIVQSKEIEMVYCNNNEQVADIFTKALSKFKFEKFRSKLGVSSKNSRGVLKT